MTPAICAEHVRFLTWTTTPEVGSLLVSNHVNPESKRPCPLSPSLQAPRPSVLPPFLTSDEVTQSFPFPNPLTRTMDLAGSHQEDADSIFLRSKKPEHEGGLGAEIRARLSDSGGMNGFDTQPMEKKKQPRHDHTAPDAYTHLDELQGVLANVVLRARYITLRCTCLCASLYPDLLRCKVRTVSFLIKPSSIYIICVSLVLLHSPSKKSVEIGHHFAHPTNHFWFCLHESPVR